VIEATVRSFWADRLRNAPEAIERYCADDVVFRILGGAPDAPTMFSGREAVLEAVRTIDTNLEFLSFEIVDLIVDGGEVGLRWLASLRHRGTGALGDLAVFDLIRIQNGLIVSYSEFLDTDGFNRLISGNSQPLLARRSNAVRPSVERPAASPSADILASSAVSARDRHEDLLRSFRIARAADGAAAVERFFTEDGELHVIGDPTSIPFARSHYGRDAARELVRQIDLEFACESFAVEKVLVDGDRAAMHWTAIVKHHGTGARGRVESLDHVLLRDGRICSLTEFFDTAATASWIAG
ncbi:MAG: nuclear transport factor 2 family protein, partial [Beijerinckiaceae bacterium]